MQALLDRYRQGPLRQTAHRQSAAEQLIKRLSDWTDWLLVIATLIIIAGFLFALWVWLMA